MAQQTIYTLPESLITVGGGGQLSGINQGDGSHLVGLDITLNSSEWEPVIIDEADGDTGFGDSDSSQALAGTISYDSETYAAGRRVEAEFSITVQDPDGNSYEILAFNINEPGVTSYATVEGLAFVGGPGGFPPVGVPLTVISAREGPNVAYDNLATPICFAAGTRIAVPCGWRAIEDIAAGDPVITRDSGAQQVLWAGRVFWPRAALARVQEARPVRVAAGTFGPGTPRRDVILSPQHRILVTGWQAQLCAGADEVLVPVHKLVGLRGIAPAAVTGDITYHHLLLQAHHVLDAEGLPAESFLPGADHPIAGPDAALGAAWKAVPQQTARPCASGPEARLIAAL